MKKTLLFKALLSLFTIGFIPSIFAQIHIVPDIPSPVYNYNYPSGHPYFGYSGDPILYNNKLYTNNASVVVTQQLVQFHGTNPVCFLHFINNDFVQTQKLVKK